MDHVVFRIAPTPTGWALSSRGGAPFLLRSRRMAELQGCRFAHALARMGRSTEIQVFDRDGSLIADLTYASARPQRPVEVGRRRAVRLTEVVGTA